MKNTLHVLPILLAASALAQTAPASAPAKSAWTESHNIALATDYVFRGVTQISGDGIALSGGTDLAHSSGFSLGLWAANQSWTPTVGSGLELDVYAGYTVSLADLSVSLGVISYHYQGYNAANTTEANVGLAAYGFSLKYSHSLTDYFDFVDSNGAGYLDASYSVTASDITFGLHFGATFGEGGQESYNDYKVSVSYPIAGYTATLAYTDVDGFDTSPQYADEIVFSLSRTF
jgi:uncharacterized protein (TIGR02001 family)